ncbi:MAG: zinc ribbon domain-containing protein [Pseudomonadota bacterium]
MPIYEYRCDNCGHELEAMRKLSEEPLTLCPKCNMHALRKKISAAGFRLKGGGWYETDFKSGKKKNVSGGDSGSSDSGDSSSGSSSSSDSDSSSSSSSSSGASSD